MFVVEIEVLVVPSLPAWNGEVCMVQAGVTT